MGKLYLHTDRYTNINTLVMKPLIKLSLLCLLVLTGLTSAFAQTKKERQAEKIAAIKSMIDSSRYVFNADYAYPLRGSQKALTSSDYDLKVSKDSVIAYLPYYGRAYVAPYNPTEGGIKFTSTNFTYSKKLKKDGSWQISIKPKDHNITDWRDVQQLTFDISPDGYASLQVLSSNRDPISFNGTIGLK